MTNRSANNKSASGGGWGGGDRSSLGFGGSTTIRGRGWRLRHRPAGREKGIEYCSAFAPRFRQPTKPGRSGRVIPSAVTEIRFLREPSGCAALDGPIEGVVVRTRESFGLRNVGRKIKRASIIPNISDHRVSNLQINARLIGVSEPEETGRRYRFSFFFFKSRSTKIATRLTSRSYKPTNVLRNEKSRYIIRVISLQRISPSLFTLGFTDSTLVRLRIDRKSRYDMPRNPNSGNLQYITVDYNVPEMPPFPSNTVRTDGHIWGEREDT